MDNNNSSVEILESEQMKVSNDVVYYKNGSNYYLYSMEDVLNGEYNVTSYYDKASTRIRVIIIS